MHAKASVFSPPQTASPAPRMPQERNKLRRVRSTPHVAATRGRGMPQLCLYDAEAANLVPPPPAHSHFPSLCCCYGLVHPLRCLRWSYPGVLSGVLIEMGESSHPWRWALRRARAPHAHTCGAPLAACAHSALFVTRGPRTLAVKTDRSHLKANAPPQNVALSGRRF